MMATSASVGEVTTELLEAVLFPRNGSVVAADTATEFVIVVPGAVVAATFNTNENVEEAFKAIEGLVHVSTPPTGAGQVHPPGTGVSETKVVFEGSVSVNWTEVAAAGPLFVTLMA
jgi:hypothetical protein